MKRRYKSISLARKKIKREIGSLLEEAFKLRFTNPEASRNLISTVLRLSLKSRVRIPRKYKIFICKRCGTLMASTGSLRVRLRTRREPHAVYKCLECGSVKRFNLRRKRWIKRRERK